MVIAIGLATTAVIARNEADRQRLRAEQEAMSICLKRLIKGMLPQLRLPVFSILENTR